MPLHRLLRLSAARRRLTEWLILAAGLVSSGLVLVWMVWTERAEALSEDADRMRAQAVVIDQTLHRQLEISPEIDALNCVSVVLPCWRRP
ncbi:hypothetical protein GCM10025794_19910 [Massilia kyonggiensis]